MSRSTVNDPCRSAIEYSLADKYNTLSENDIFTILFEDQVAFLFETFSQTGWLLKRPVIEYCKPPREFYDEQYYSWLLRPGDLW